MKTKEPIQDGDRNRTNGHEAGQPLIPDLNCNAHTNVTRRTEVQTEPLRGNNCRDNSVLKSGVKAKPFTGTSQEEFELHLIIIIYQSASHTDSQGLNVQLKEIDTDLEKIDTSEVIKSIPNKPKSCASNSTIHHHKLSEACDSQQPPLSHFEFFQLGRSKQEQQ